MLRYFITLSLFFTVSVRPCRSFPHLRVFFFYSLIPVVGLKPFGFICSAVTWLATTLWKLLKDEMLTYVGKYFPSRLSRITAQASLLFRFVFFFPPTDPGAASLIFNVDRIQQKWSRRIEKACRHLWMCQTKKKKKLRRQSDLLAFGVSSKHKLLHACLVCRFWLPVSSEQVFLLLCLRKQVKAREDDTKLIGQRIRDMISMRD